MERPGGIAPPSAVGLMSPARFRAGLLQRRGGNHRPCVPAGLAPAAGFEPAGRIYARANRRFNSSRLDLHVFNVYHSAGVAFGAKEGELADDRLFGHAQPRLASAYGASDPVLRHVFFSFACIVSPARQKVLYTLKEGRSPLDQVRLRICWMYLEMVSRSSLQSASRIISSISWAKSSMYSLTVSISCRLHSLDLVVR